MEWPPIKPGKQDPPGNPTSQAGEKRGVSGPHAWPSDSRRGSAWPNLPRLFAVFILGAGLGGIAGWQVAVHGRPGSDRARELAETRTASNRNNDSRSQPGAKAPRFVPSADSTADLHRILRMRDAAARTSAFDQLLSTLKPEAVADLLKALGRYHADQEQEDQIGGLMALMTARRIVIDHISQSAPDEVLAALAGQGPNSPGSGDYADVLRTWAARDPEAARMFFEQTTLGEKGVDVRAVAGSLVRELVKDDPEGTFQWLRQLKADFVQQVARDALQTLSHYDGVKAGKLLATNKDLLKASDCVAAMAAGWSRTEPDKAFQWALDLPADISADGIKTAAGAWSGKDFTAAITAIGALDHRQRAAALEGIASASGGKHLQELLPLVETLPESGERAAAVGSLIGSWADQSPDRAAAWLSASPAGESRDRGAIVLALKTMHSDPESALEWASSIGAADQRMKGVDGVLDVWLKNDPAAARAWVAGTPRLSGEERSRLLEKTGR